MRSSTRYNHERPHQALGMKVPADLYTRSPRVVSGPRGARRIRFMMRP